MEANVSLSACGRSKDLTQRLDRSRQTYCREFAGRRLQVEPKKRGLLTYWEKELLVTRLSIGRNAKIGKGDRGKTNKEDKCMTGLPAMAIWELVNPMTNPVIKPSNVDLTLKPPTWPSGPVNSKYGYSDVFGGSSFTWRDEKFVMPSEKPRSKRSQQNTKSLSKPRHN